MAFLAFVLEAIKVQRYGCACQDGRKRRVGGIADQRSIDGAARHAAPKETHARRHRNIYAGSVGKTENRLMLLCGEIIISPALILP